MIVRNDSDINNLIKSGRIANELLSRMCFLAKNETGITTKQLDNFAGDFIKEHDAESAPVKDYDFPGNTCISVFPVISHGIPSDTKIKDGDLVHLDVSIAYDGFYTDTGNSIFIGNEPPEIQELFSVTKLCLSNVLDKIKANDRLKKVGTTVERTLLPYKDRFYVLSEFNGHGIGERLHEAPLNIPHHKDRSETRTLQDGLVVAIEPYIAMGMPTIISNNEWMSSVTNGVFVAQFEHTIIIQKNAHPIILT